MGTQVQILVNRIGVESVLDLGQSVSEASSYPVKPLRWSILRKWLKAVNYFHKTSHLRCFT